MNHRAENRKDEFAISSTRKLTSSTGEPMFICKVFPFEVEFLSFISRSGFFLICWILFPNRDIEFIYGFNVHNHRSFSVYIYIRTDSFIVYVSVSVSVSVSVFDRQESARMKRSFVIDPAFDPNAPAKSSAHAWIQPLYHGIHNTVPVPRYPATCEVDEGDLAQRVRQRVEVFWQRQLIEMENFTGGFKEQNILPLARVKKIMKSDPEVKMIGADTPPVFAKACELFILEMTLRAWIQTESRNRRTIQQCDLAEAVKLSETFDFLLDLVPFGPHCVRHQGVDQDAVHERLQVGPEPVFPLPSMNHLVSLDPIGQIPEVPPELMAGSSADLEPLGLNFNFP